LPEDLFEQMTKIISANRSI